MFPSSERIPDARFLQAKALVMLARFEDAIVVLDTFIELSPNGPRSFEALMLRGEALIAASPIVPHFGDAAISFSMALEIDGLSRENRIDATLHLADALLRMGDRVGAEQAFGRLSAAERRAAADAAEARGFRRVARFRPAT
jgi:tetratricopeptide (TPR) repeat protein